MPNTLTEVQNRETLYAEHRRANTAMRARLVRKARKRQAPKYFRVRLELWGSEARLLRQSLRATLRRALKARHDSGRLTHPQAAEWKLNDYTEIRSMIALLRYLDVRTWEAEHTS